MNEPIKFTNRPQCVKCGEERCQWHIIATDTSTIGQLPWTDTTGGDILQLTCGRCGWKWLMHTLDYDGNE